MGISMFGGSHISGEDLLRQVLGFSPVEHIDSFDEARQGSALLVKSVQDAVLANWTNSDDRIYILNVCLNQGQDERERLCESIKKGIQSNTLNAIQGFLLKAQNPDRPITRIQRPSGK